MRVEPYQGSPEEWDAFVRGSAGWTHCHLSRWARVIERVFGHECPYLCARDTAGDLRGVLPLVRVESSLFGRYLVSMPFLNYGGPLGDAEAVQALAGAGVERARGRQALLELRSRGELAIDLPVSHRKITVLLDPLPRDPERLWGSLPGKVRSQIRRPRKEGVEVRFGPDQVAPFFEVFARHMRDLGTPTLPRRFFEALVDDFPGDVWFGCAWLSGRPIAGGCGLAWGEEFEMTWASALREYGPIAANMLLYWEFLALAMARGLSVFNFGRCTPGGNTHRFKRQWGGRDQELWWYGSAHGRRTEAPSPSEGAYAWGPRLWRRLPVSVATLLGPRIVRQIP